jgi:hypothetical protein
VTYHDPVKPKCHDHLLHLWRKPVWFSEDLLATFDRWATRSVKNENGGNGSPEETCQTVEDGAELGILTCLRVRNNEDMLALSEPQTTDDSSGVNTQ